MKKFKIVYDRMMYGTVEVEADNLEQAIQEARMKPIKESDDMIDDWELYREMCTEISE